MEQTTERKKAVLIDGSGYIFRAFYALPPMGRDDGTPVNAVYGFCNMLMKLIKEMPADYLAVVFDAARVTFRQTIYPAYKATRRETPEALIPQFPILRQAVEAFDVAQVEMEGYEADDLLSTYARLAHERGIEVTIVSSDKDLMQMVGSGVTIFDPMKQRVVDVEQVLEKFGVTPDKVVDVQSLAGDSTDNVPGVSGIGLKTAAQLINEYGTLENLLANAENIKQPKRREALIKDADMARLSKKLVTLDAFAPVEVPLDAFAVKVPDSEKIKKFLEKQTFKSLLSKLPNWITARAETMPNLPRPALPEIREVKKEYTLIQTPDVLQKWVDDAIKKGVVAVDTETDSLSQTRARIVGFSLCCEEGKACYVPLRHKGKAKQGELFGGAEDSVEEIKQLSVSEALDILKPLLTDKSVLKVGHNVKYDWHVFANEYGDGLDITPIEDTMVLSYDLDGAAHGHGMDELAELFLDYQTIRYEDVCGKGKLKISFDRVELQPACDYAAEDADITLRLYHYLKRRLLNERMVGIYELFDRPTVPVLFNMERAGIKVCDKELQKLSDSFGARIKDLEKRIFELAGEEFNLNSPGQMGKILFDKMGLKGSTKNAKTGSWSTEAAVLETLVDEGIEIAAKILEWRQYSKLKSTYSDALQEQINPRTGRVHTNFMQTVTSTGRLSSNDPNLQNIPVRSEEGREIRRAFIAEKGKVLLSADYSQIELRLMAHVANVEGLKDAFARGADIHAATASKMFHIPVEGMDPMVRRRAKAINFGIIYGISAFGLARQLGTSRTEAQEYINAYFDRYPEIKTFMEDTVSFARSNGYVMTPFGRKCSVGNLNDRNAARRAFAERAAVNAPIQGGAADIIKKAMLRLPDALTEAGLTGKMLLQVHDELVLEIPESEIEKTTTVVKDIMENVFKLSVPLIAEVGTGMNWAEAH